MLGPAADEIEVKVRYSTRLLHPAKQHYEETLSALVRDGKQRLHLNHTNIRRAIYPQEFMLAATYLNDFEFVGWWNDWDLSLPSMKLPVELCVLLLYCADASSFSGSDQTKP